MQVATCARAITTSQLCTCPCSVLPLRLDQTSGCRTRSPLSKACVSKPRVSIRGRPGGRYCCMLSGRGRRARACSSQQLAQSVNFGFAHAFLQPLHATDASQERPPLRWWRTVSRPVVAPHDELRRAASQRAQVQCRWRRSCKRCCRLLMALVHAQQLYDHGRLRGRAATGSHRRQRLHPGWSERSLRRRPGHARLGCAGAQLRRRRIASGNALHSKCLQGARCVQARASR